MKNKITMIVFVHHPYDNTMAQKMDTRHKTNLQIRIPMSDNPLTLIEGIKLILILKPYLEEYSFSVDNLKCEVRSEGVSMMGINNRSLVLEYQGSRLSSKEEISLYENKITSTFENTENVIFLKEL